MPVAIPPARPQQDPATTAQQLLAANVHDSVAVVAIRGYYRDTMGVPGVNDRGIYDDAFIVVSPSVHASFNGNTDPSVYRPGIATLKPGVWRYKPGIHGLSRPPALQYPAFVQAAEVTVLRDPNGVAHGHPDEQPTEDTGWFGINLHRGGIETTSSLGCLTVPPMQWDSFHQLVLDQLHRYSQTDFPLLLIAR